MFGVGLWGGGWAAKAAQTPPSWGDWGFGNRGLRIAKKIQFLSQNLTFFPLTLCLGHVSMLSSGVGEPKIACFPAMYEYFRRWHNFCWKTAWDFYTLFLSLHPKSILLFLKAIFLKLWCKMSAKMPQRLSIFWLLDKFSRPKGTPYEKPWKNWSFLKASAL